jgi:hypothetical protein
MHGMITQEGKEDAHPIIGVFTSTNIDDIFERER